MSIEYAILGLLSHQSQTGYDIKKIMQESPFMYWSGNNNQIYKALLELRKGDLVANEIQHQDGAPSKKVYSITESGLAELHRWTLTTPKAPEVKNAFLVQLAFSWQAGRLALQELLQEYAREVQGQLFMAQKKSEAASVPGKTPRDNAVWKLIHERVIDAYRQELAWIDHVHQTIDPFEDAVSAPALPTPQNSAIEDVNTMEYQLIEKNKKYLYLNPAGKSIQTEQDGLDLIALCIENGVNRLLIHSGRLSDEFFRLRTGLAGAILQKFSQYNIKAAVLLEGEHIRGKFEDFLLESNRGRQFRAYESFREAENWLTASE